MKTVYLRLQWLIMDLIIPESKKDIKQGKELIQQFNSKQQNFQPIQKTNNLKVDLIKLTENSLYGQSIRKDVDENYIA